MMPDPLPAEMLDHVVDYLHDTQDTLRNCCLVSKSWVPRTRKHLFADIGFPTAKSLQSWKETFPDPSTSPAYYAKALSVGCFHLVTAADAEVGGWIRGFSHIVHLEVASRAMRSDPNKLGISLVPFHGISPIIKSLRVVVPHLPSSRILFDLILSFPLLEDLAVMIFGAPIDGGDDSEEDEMLTAVQPSSPRMFTGTLELHMFEGVEPFARRLMSLPGGTHFRKLAMVWFYEETLWLAAALVEECSHTLESLDVFWGLRGASRSAPVDLSKATKLKDVAFRPGLQRVEWVIRALQTITPEHRDLRQITIRMPWYPLAEVLANIRQTVGDTHYRLWLDLDRLLVQLWESRSIRPKVIRMKRCTEESVGRFFPEITKREIIDFVDC